MNTFGERLKQVIKELKIKNVELASKTEKSRQTISSYIYNRSEPDNFFLQKMQSCYKINLNWLITGSGEMFLTEAANVSQGEDVNVLKKEIEHLKEVQNTLMRTLDTLTSIDKKSFNKVVRETGDKINLLDEKLVRVIPFLNLYRKGTVERTA